MKKTTKKTSPAATKASIAAAKAPAKKTPAPAKRRAHITEPPATFISAKVDVGFGNHLYLRGEGPGLSWDRGIAMDCTAADLWTSTVKGATGPVTFKVLINDTTWCDANDFVAEPGQSITVNPVF